MYRFENGARVLSLFDGMSCGMIAMKIAGVDVSQYDAYEIDKHAVKASQHNFPDIMHHGDVFQADFTQYRGTDFLIGGSPCVFWSIAQSPDKRETTASGLGWDLFSQYVRAVREAQPKMFIYENNKSMSNAIRQSISETFGFEPICINSALVSAQNRQRLYWVGVRQPDGTYRKADISQPEDRGIFMRDILDTANYLPYNPDRNGKSPCLLSSYYKCGDSPAPSGFGNDIARPRAAEPIGVAQRGRYHHNPNNDTPTEQHIEARGDGKSNALTTVSKDCLVCEPTALQEQPFGRKADESGHYDRRYEAKTDGKSAALTSIESRRMVAIPEQAAETSEKKAYEVRDGVIEIDGKRYPIKLKDGRYIIRKLTVTECMRPQTVPEWYDFSCVSNTQAYKMLGNGWTCEVIAHLIRGVMKSYFGEQHDNDSD